MPKRTTKKEKVLKKRKKNEKKNDQVTTQSLSSPLSYGYDGHSKLINRFWEEKGGRL
jgi:hypothetical protein